MDAPPRNPDAEPTADDHATGLPLPVATIAAAMQARVDAGWRWDDATATLSDPADAAAFFRVDTRTHRVTVSPKLAAQLSRPPTGQEGQP